MRVVNLARRPFVNSRPVARAALLAWIAAGLVALINAILYGNYWSSSADIRGELAELDGQIAAEAAAFDELSAELETLDLGEQNEDVRFLNLLIDYRTFPWSGLFEDLESVLPDDVRLVSVSPAIDFAVGTAAQRSTTRSRPGAAASRGRGGKQPPRIDSTRTEVVPLDLQGFTRREEALYELLDTLYANPSFREPVLDQESQSGQSGEIAFSLQVSYLTGSAVLPGGLAAPQVIETGAAGSAIGDGGVDAGAIGDGGGEGRSGGAGEGSTRLAAGDPRFESAAIGRWDDDSRRRGGESGARPDAVASSRPSRSTGAPPPSGRVPSAPPPAAGSRAAGSPPATGAFVGVPVQPAAAAGGGTPATPSPRPSTGTPTTRSPAAGDSADDGRYRPRPSSPRGDDETAPPRDRQPTPPRPDASGSARLDGGGGAP